MRTKVIATVGPASSSPQMLGRLIDAGVNVFRLNFSHGTHATHGAALTAIRAAAAERGAHVAVMGDLCGPKIRLNAIAGGQAELRDGATVQFVRGDGPGDASRLTCSYAALIDDVRAGDRLLIDDGRVTLRTTAKSGDALSCTVEVGGVVSDRKGINLPDSPVRVDALTDKDRVDAAWAAQNGVDYLALSFVRRPADLVALRAALGPAGSELPIVAKIEKSAAIAELDGILDAADAVLVARGDLGVEMPIERVPMLQKAIARRCQYAGKPVIVATQMLQSMVDSPTPTRAEVSDAANAILDHADALMLSAETAVGRYPVEAVRMLARVAEHTETFLERFRAAPDAEVLAASMRLTSAVAHGACLLARDLDVSLLAVHTQSGITARLISKNRPTQRIFGLCSDARVCRRMALYFGVTPLAAEFRNEPDSLLRELDDLLLARGWAEPGELSIVVVGTQLSHPGSSNALLIHRVHGGAPGAPAEGS
ncbi:MAG: pyruvate kinase [Phycisphaerae bacterium]